MGELEKLITNSCKLSMSDVNYRFFRQRKNIYTLTLKLKSDEVITIDGKRVAKVRLLYTNRDAEFKNTEHDPQYKEEGVWQITFADKTKVTKPANADSILTCAAELKKLGAQQRYFDQTISGGPAWNTKAMRHVYDENVDYTPAETYKKLHAFITHQIIEFSKAKQITEANIIDGGCGSGLFLKSLEKQTPPHTTWHLMGFDFNAENIAECQANYDGQATFVTGNLLEVDTIILSRKACPTFLVLSGSLTRLVLHNGFEALQVLQKAALSQVDYLIGGGQGLPLINDFIAKRVGYKMILNNMHTSGKSFFYEKLTPEEILQNKVKKIQTRSKLDLSLSPNAVEILVELKKQGHLKAGLTIDFSYCPLTDDAIKMIHSLIQEYPDTKLVFFHWDQKLLQLFQKQFPAADVQKVFNDWYLTAPHDFHASLDSVVALTNRPSPAINEITSQELKYYVDSHNIPAIESFLESKPDLYNLRVLRDHALFRSEWSIAAAVIQRKPSLGSLNSKEKEKYIPEVIKIIATKKSYAALYALLYNFINDFPTLDSFLVVLQANAIDLSLIKNEEGYTLLNAALNSIAHRHHFGEEKSDSNTSMMVQDLMNAETGHTSLHTAIQNQPCNLFILTLLQLKKVNLDLTNRDGMNLLHCAANSYNIAMVNYLATHHPALLNQTDYMTSTPVHYLLTNPSCQIADLELLKKNSANLYIPDYSGDLPLHLYMKSRKDKNLSLEILNFYLENYPDLLYKENKAGQTVMGIAIAKKDTQALALLANKNFLKAASQYKFFRPVSLQMDTLEVTPVGNFGVIDTLHIETVNNKILAVQLHYQGSGAEEKLPTEMRDYLQREVAGATISLDEKTQTIRLDNIYYSSESSGTQHTYDLLNKDSNQPVSVNTKTIEGDPLTIPQIEQLLAVLEKVSAISAVTRQVIAKTIEQLQQQLKPPSLGAK
jgi:ankyrin repeat protein